MPPFSAASEVLFPAARRPPTTQVVEVKAGVRRHVPITRPDVLFSAFRLTLVTRPSKKSKLWFRKDAIFEHTLKPVAQPIDVRPSADDVARPSETAVLDAIQLLMVQPRPRPTLHGPPPLELTFSVVGRLNI